MAGKDEKTITIAAIERAGSAGQQGPLWNIVDTEGNGYPTERGAQCNYSVGNPDFREGCTVVITVTPGGKIRRMTTPAGRTS